VIFFTSDNRFMRERLDRNAFLFLSVTSSPSATFCFSSMNFSSVTEGRTVSSHARNSYGKELLQGVRATFFLTG